MRIGLALPQFDVSVPGERPLQWQTVLDWATRAESSGFDSLWLADHLFWDLSRYGGSDERVASFAPLPALAAIARRTSAVRLGTLVVNAALRPPALLAKALATLDVVTQGRLTIGLGAGWYEPEFLTAGVPFERPGARLRHLAECAQVLRGLFGGDPFTFHGRHATVADAPCQPAPVQQPAPPIVFGGRGDELLKVTARHADGWNTVWVWTPEAYQERLRALARACEVVGRDPAKVTRSLGLYALAGEGERDLERRFERLRRRAPPGVLDGMSLADWRRGRLVGTVDQVRGQLETWRALGVDELIVNTGPAPFVAGAADDVETIAAACSLEPPCPASEFPN